MNSSPKDIPRRKSESPTKSRMHKESISSLGSVVSFEMSNYGIDSSSDSQDEHLHKDSTSTVVNESVEEDGDEEEEEEDDGSSYYSATSAAISPQIPYAVLLTNKAKEQQNDDGDLIFPEFEKLQINTEKLPPTMDITASLERLSKQPMEAGDGMITSPVIASLDVADRLNKGTFFNWCLAFVCLNFDLEIGQAIDVIYPSEDLQQFSDSDKSNIRFSSFPDTSSLTGDTVFSYRFPSSEDTSTFIYGYAFFRQQKDETIRRGYLQRSICLLSKLAFPGLFLRIIALIGPLYMDCVKVGGNHHQTASKAILDAAAHAISQWPNPVAGVILDLPFLGSLLRVEMPGDYSQTGVRSQLLTTSLFMSQSRKNARNIQGKRGSVSNIGNSPVNGEQILPTLPCTLVYPTGFITSQQHIEEVNDVSCDIPLLSAKNANIELPGTSLGLLYRFFDNLEHLWSVWELVLLGEPIIVMGKSQCVVSETVWWMSDLIKPIPYRGDYRPYFTIQDSDFRKFTGSSKSSTVMNGNNSSNSNSTGFYQLNTNSSSSNVILNSGSNFSSPAASRANFSSRPTTPNRSAASIPASGVYLTPKNLSEVSFRLKLRDSSAAFLNVESMPERSVIIGVTNPFFGRALDGWPHVLRVSTGPLVDHLQQIPQNPPSKKKWTIKNMRASNASNSSSKSLLDFSPGLTTEYKPFVIRDKKFIKALQEAFESGTRIPVQTQKESRFQAFFSSNNSLIDNPIINAASSQSSTTNLNINNNNNSQSKSNIENTLQNIATSPTSTKRYKAYALNEALRRHFVELTERFLVPLNRYFSMLIPTPVLLPWSADLPCALTHQNQKIIFQPPPPISTFKVRPFDTNAFFSQLQSHGPPKLPFHPSVATSLSSSASSNRSWIEMYSRFLESPNFIGWLMDRKQVAEFQVRSIYLEQLRNGASGRNVPDLDLFLMIRRELMWVGYDPVYEDNVQMYKNITKNPAKFCLVSAEIKKDLEIISRVLWSRFSLEIRSGFKAGIFDQYLSSNHPHEEEDYILVI